MQLYANGDHREHVLFIHMESGTVGVTYKVAVCLGFALRKP